MGGCKSSLFGNGAQYIKVSGGDFIAVDGANIIEKLMVSDLRMPYKELLKTRVTIKEGEDYLLDHFDNVTFIALKVIYDAKSVIEEDNFINWNFSDSPTTYGPTYSIAQMMCLTGNSTNPLQNILVTNPSIKYPVTVEVMIAKL